MWGFAASPLVADKVVLVYAGGPGDKGLLAFDVESGALRWSVAAGTDSYSSPQLSTIAGEKRWSSCSPTMAWPWSIPPLGSPG
jgi:outer membrane protein assembly factor BamB